VCVIGVVILDTGHPLMSHPTDIKNTNQPIPPPKKKKNKKKKKHRKEPYLTKII
jgi:hypothetical protein